MIFAILIGLVFVIVIAIMALGIVYYARDYCDETLPSSIDLSDKSDKSE